MLQKLIQLILIIHRFCIYECTYSWKFMYNPKINTCDVSLVICRQAQSGKIFELLMHPWGRTENHSVFLFQISYHKHILFTFLCFLMVISLVQIAPKHRAEMLSALHKHRKVMKHLKKKICILNNLHSSMSYSAVDHRFYVKWIVSMY